MSSTHGPNAHVTSTPAASQNYNNNFDSIFGKKRLNVQDKTEETEVKSEEKTEDSKDT
jgi:hypothetical protein